MEHNKVAHNDFRMPCALLVQRAVTLQVRLLGLAVTLVGSGAPGAGAAPSGAVPVS